MRALAALLRDPVGAEKRERMKDRWAALDELVRYPLQGLGRQSAGCAATIGVQPRCDFSCTGCYLGVEANRIPPMSLPDIFEQLRKIRRWLGPKSNVQITDGEVTLRPLPELIAILRYARRLGMIPMVMTHGDTLRRRPGFLEILMAEGGLTEMAIHIDITQRGRAGYPHPRSELDLMPLREEFARLIRDARKKTGRPMRAAMTVTVTQDNLPQVGEIVRWAVFNSDAFRLVSFQTVADVGRTRKGLRGVRRTDLWKEIGGAAQSFGLYLTEDAGPLAFGHAACTRIVPVWVYHKRGREPRLMPLVGDGAEDQQLAREGLARGLGGMNFRDDRPPERVARALGFILRAPVWVFGPLRRWMCRRIREHFGEGILRVMFHTLFGRACVRMLTLTSHHFMNSQELLTPTGQERLRSCVFRVPVDDRMVSMCEMNAGGGRTDVYRSLEVNGAPASIFQ